MAARASCWGFKFKILRQMDLSERKCRNDSTSSHPRMSYFKNMYILAAGVMQTCKFRRWAELLIDCRQCTVLELVIDQRCFLICMYAYVSCMQNLAFRPLLSQTRFCIQDRHDQSEEIWVHW